MIRNQISMHDQKYQIDQIIINNYYIFHKAKTDEVVNEPIKEEGKQKKWIKTFAREYGI